MFAVASFCRDDESVVFCLIMNALLTLIHNSSSICHFESSQQVVTPEHQ